jgi:hypothetical protein
MIGNNGASDMNDSWQRRQAVQLTAMLPEKTDDALLVLELAIQLVMGFLAEGRQEGLCERSFSSRANGKALSSP